MLPCRTIRASPAANRVISVVQNVCCPSTPRLCVARSVPLPTFSASSVIRSFALVAVTKKNNGTMVQTCRRGIATSTLPTKTKVARYEKFGPIDTVVKIKEEALEPLQPNQVLLQFMAAPINPADINMIEGVYNIQPALPAVGGNEGVAKVIGIGSQVKSLKVGDWVIPALPGFGTWRQYAICDEEEVDPIDGNVPVELAATISVNPCSAYRMLNDFTKLKKGDLIIQNGANSSVGMAVIQLCKHMGVQTINVVRDRPNLNELVSKLRSLGANEVITDDTLNTPRLMQEVLNKFKGQEPILGLNCVGGNSASDIVRLLKDGSNLVTYGGMSRKPVAVPTGRLIFNDISLRGFWLSRWTETHTKDERRQMINEILSLIRNKEFQSFVTKKPFDDFESALAEARKGFKENKVVLTF